MTCHVSRWADYTVRCSSGPVLVDITDNSVDTGADAETVETIDGEPVIEQEPVIHPGGSQDVDYDTVSHVGVHSVVQVGLSPTQ